MKEDIGVAVPEILLPAENADLTKWAVVACDQFTSEPGYWEELSGKIGEAPSTYHITFPEVYLGKGSDSERIKRINCTMNRYLSEGVFRAPVNGFILTCRSTAYSKRRLGLVLSVDLERYSYRAEDRALIRATEGTILSRIPPRVAIRENAPLELPHIMLLIDDRAASVIEPLYAEREQLKKLYDFELGMGGGHIAGYYVADTERVANALACLLNPAVLTEKYGGADPFLFAVGDGNHSLATAKTCWENIKKKLTPAQAEGHPARYALVEAVNVFDKGLAFEPIHRVVFGVKNGFIAGLKQVVSGFTGSGALVLGGKKEPLTLPESAPEAVSAVQEYIDGAIAQGLAAGVDYVHGEESVTSVVNANAESIGILLPKMEKGDLFRYVLQNGSLPRKTFSMGEATEKRYYLEARKIK